MKKRTTVAGVPLVALGSGLDGEGRRGAGTEGWFGFITGSGYRFIRRTGASLGSKKAKVAWCVYSDEYRSMVGDDSARLVDAVAMARDHKQRSVKVGTANFPTVSDAVAYFSAQNNEWPDGCPHCGVTAADVRRKIEDGEIHIGKPQVKPGEVVYAVNERPGIRYWVKSISGG